MVSASRDVLDRLADSLRQYAVSHPVHLPSLSPVKAEAYELLKPQGGMDDPLSHTEDGSLFHRACNNLNSVGYTINQAQLDFVLALCNAPRSTHLLPGHEMPPLPSYQDDMDDEQRALVRRERAKAYARQRVWRNQRTKLLSSLSVVRQYQNKEVFFNVRADFRGRIYPEADIISYQGTDWIRSLWQFSQGKAIDTVEQGHWLYINAANCLGLSRQSFDSRVSYISDRMDEWRALAADPLEYVELLEQASDPFRFVAAIREVVAYEAHGLGYVSHIPVQIDASSQAIQIWAGLTGTRELLIASNVLDSGECRDIYQELASDIYADAMNDACDGAIPWRISGIDRKVVKQAMMIIPYGGTYVSIQRIVDSHYQDTPNAARVWLCNRLWHDSRDILHDLVKMQETLAQAVSEDLRNNGGSTYTWASPCGVQVTQRYMRTKRHRIKNAIGETLYSYRLDTDQVSTHKHSTAFAANFLHSLDASLLCHAVSAMDDAGVTSVMPIHDCVGVLAADVTSAKHILSSSYLWLLSEGHTLTEGLCNILKVGGGGADPCYDGLPRAFPTPEEVSPYLFS